MATLGVPRSKPNPQPGQIWFLEEPRLRDADHGHYVLVTQVLAGEGKVCFNFISTGSSFHDDFRIESDADGFAESGLEHTCHLLRQHAYDLLISNFLSGADYKGFLAGRLKSAIEDWWGEPL